MTIREVIERVQAYHPSFNVAESCDGFKSGSPDDECTGIVSALVPTIEVIQKTAELGANLLFVHEGTYYMTPDYPDWHTDFPNAVCDVKKLLLEQNQIAVYRDHDGMHLHKPDSIFTGVMKYLGWEPYYAGDNQNVPFYYLFHLPECTVQELREELMEKLQLNGLRYVGRADSRVKNVAIVGHLCPGIWGEEKEDECGHYRDYSTALIREFEAGRVDVIIPGELIEWNVVAYIRDAAQLGQNVACLNVGHFNVEELGMCYAKDWLEDLIDHQLPVHYVPSGDSFQF